MATKPILSVGENPKPNPVDPGLDSATSQDINHVKHFGIRFFEPEQEDKKMARIVIFHSDNPKRKKA